MNDIGLATHIGPREVLEDDLLGLHVTSPPPCEPATLLGVFDGVGGNQAGEHASREASVVVTEGVASLLLRVGRGQTVAPDTVLSTLVTSCEAANEAIVEQAAEDDELRGMATTAVCALLMAAQLYIAWAGDSRCWLWREGNLKQLTTDHSLAQRLVDAGFGSTDQIGADRINHVIYNYLGNPKGCQVDTRLVPLKVGDVVMVASDGLSDVLSGADIESALTEAFDKGLSAQATADQLIDLVLERGAKDNVAVALCSYEPTPTPRPVLTQRTITDGYAAAVAAVLQTTYQEYRP